jgi:hypothetical protein
MKEVFKILFISVIKTHVAAADFTDMSFLNLESQTNITEATFGI